MPPYPPVLAAVSPGGECVPWGLPGRIRGYCLAQAGLTGASGGPYSEAMTGDAVPVDHGGDAAALGELRASHEDRDEVVEQLRVAAGNGRLTADELDQRLEAALTARTCGELAALTADLPGGPGRGITATAGARPADTAAIIGGGGTARRDGRWIVPPTLEVRVASGKVVLDFTDAVVRSPEVQVDVNVRSGSLVIVTRPGMVVDAGNVAVRSGEVKVRSGWGQQGPVTLRIGLTGTVGSGNITVRPPRRTFPQWLRRMRQHLADK